MDLPRVIQEEYIDFGIDLESDTKTMCIAPYRMSQGKLKEFKD